MKKFFAVLFVSLFVGMSQIHAQSIESLLDKASSLGVNTKNAGQLADLLGSSLKMLEKESATANTDIKGKLLGEMGNLKSILPALATGKANANTLSGIINKIKLLVAANRLKNMLTGGKSSLLGNSAAVLSNLNLLKGASSALGSNAGNLTKLIGGATKTASKLDKGGIFKGLRAKSSGKSLTKIVDLVTSSL